LLTIDIPACSGLPLKTCFRSTLPIKIQIEFEQSVSPKKALLNTKVLPNMRFVDNGKVISTAGISAGIDGALHFVAKFKGAEFAKKSCRRY